MTPNTTCAPAAAPSVASESAKQFASFMSLTGRCSRSRGWLIVEALRAYLATPVRSQVREPDAPVYAVREVADARRQHLVADLKRSPAERLQRAEQLARLARQVRPRRGRRQQVIGFDSYEDFYEWKKARLAGG